MKKLLVFLLVLVISFSVFAGNVHFVFGDVGQHSDILWGFLPSYAFIGAGYYTTPLIEGNTTDIRLLVGEGYTQRLMWLDPESGVNNYDNGVWDKSSALRFNIWQNEVSLRFLQGFLKSSAGDKDLVTLTLSLNGRYERYYSSSKFLFMNIKGNLDDRIDEDYSGGIYPELNGRKDFLGLEAAVSVKFDMMNDTLHTSDGFWARLDFRYGPGALNRLASGHASYHSLVLNAVGSKTLYNIENESGSSMFSVAVVDRAYASYTSGSAVPSFVSGSVSLGRNVRGFNTYTYATEFTVVNSFDIRLAGPDLGVKNIAPRVNFFIDCGYGWGRVFNTDRSEKNFLASTGVQATVSFFDFIDLGYEINFLLVDKNKYTQPGRVTTNVTFFLDF